MTTLLLQSTLSPTSGDPLHSAFEHHPRLLSLPDSVQDDVRLRKLGLVRGLIEASLRSDAAPPPSLRLQPNRSGTHTNNNNNDSSNYSHDSSGGRVAMGEGGAAHYGTKPGHFETSKIPFPTSEGVSEVSERASE